MISVSTLISLEKSVILPTNTLSIVYNQPIEWCFYKGGIWYKDENQAYARHVLFDKYFMPEYKKSKIKKLEDDNKHLKTWKIISVILIAITSGVIVLK